MNSNVACTWGGRDVIPSTIDTAAMLEVYSVVAVCRMHTNACKLLSEGYTRSAISLA